VEELRRIRFRKGLVSFKERQLQRTRQVVLPTIEAAADVEQQVAWAAGSKLRRALDFRLWTARGKGLVLLNLLVRAQAGLPACMASAPSLSALGWSAPSATQLPPAESCKIKASMHLLMKYS
jgi:hypothetical protein